MKISYNWLKEYIHPLPPPALVSELLTNCGLEVESLETVESIKGGLKGLVIGEVKTKVQHPNADRLSLTTVDVGTGTLLQIVCGGPNVAAGQKVVVAKVGTTLHPIEGEPFEIKKSKIRGEVSEGMICAEDEIGLGKSHEGVLVLDASAKVGTPVKDYFKIEDDYVFEIGLTPNHGDAASHFGVARELYAVINHQVESKIYNLKSKISLPDTSSFKIDNKNYPIAVEIDNAAACPRYSGVTLTGVTVGESPGWLKNRLKTIGISPINNIVDITNFVLHEGGLPLHAFDADEITGKKIIVRNAHGGEKFITLDEKERTLSPTDLMICNASEPMVIAGIFGGMKSGVKATTKNVFIESAYFNPASIRKTAKHHGLKTDASFRYERGADPDITIHALKRAALLIKEIAGGKISSDIVDVYPHAVKPTVISFTYDEINTIAGITISKDVVKSILVSLNIKIDKETENELTVAVPPYKHDFTGAADIAEEVLRIYGFNNIPLPHGVKLSVPKKEKVDVERVKNEIADYLSSSGFYEMVNNSLTKSKWADDKAVKILNPLSNDLDVMRQTLIYSGLQTIEYNRNRKHPNLKLYEFGKIYSKATGNETVKPQLPGYKESNHLSLFLTGKHSKDQWNSDKSNVDFFTLKSYVHNVLMKCGVNMHAQFDEQKSNHPLFTSVVIASYNKQPLSLYGSLKKSVLKQFDITNDVFFAGFNWDTLIKLSSQNKTVFASLPKFPEVKRDLSMLLDTTVTFGEIEKIAFATEHKLLKEVSLFDVYEGDKIEKGKKSYAVSFLLQDHAQTLTDAQIDKVMSRLMENFEKQAGAVIRKQ